MRSLDLLLLEIKMLEIEPVVTTTPSPPISCGGGDLLHTPFVLNSYARHPVTMPILHLLQLLLHLSHAPCSMCTSEFTHTESPEILAWTSLG
jgi:hypothetical protein